MSQMLGGAFMDFSDMFMPAMTAAGGLGMLAWSAKKFWRASKIDGGDLSMAIVALVIGVLLVAEGTYGILPAPAEGQVTRDAPLITP
ncbi:MAG: hypothetical protein AAFY38_05170 [Pseudomonadota bacterium]